jgi:hypothetical protein
MHSRLLRILLIAAVSTLGCNADDGMTSQPPAGQYFTVKVLNDTFIMLVTDPVTIQLARDNFEGKNTRFPIGKIAAGNGGFNGSWGWHFVPENVRMTEVAIEVCDGTPSYVNAHVNDYLAVGYCPWAAKVVKIGR